MTTDIWLPELLAGTQPKYLAIADRLEAAIGDGRLRGGDRVPPQRELAARLAVDLTTVTKAYELARERGLIAGRGRLGSFVREPGDTAFAQMPAVDTGMNMPPEIPDGAVSRAIADGTTALLRHDSGARLQYQPPGGALQDRIAGAELLARAGAPTTAEQVVLTAGGQNALHAILATTLVRGDAIACGRYVYSGLKSLAVRLGLRLVPLPEVSAEALEQAQSREAIRAVYLVPTNDNPTATTLTLEEREGLAAVAARHAITIVEDDAYGLLAEPALPSVSAFAPEHAWYISSTSKVISPALRVAYVRAPSVGEALQLASAVHETAVMPPPINAALVTSWVRSGRFDDLVAEMRKEARARAAVAREALQGIVHTAHAEGYHLWIPLAAGRSGRVLAEAMRGTELPVVAAERFAVGEAADTAVRVSLGGLLDHEALWRALRILQGHLALDADRPAILV